MKKLTFFFLLGAMVTLFTMAETAPGAPEA